MSLDVECRDRINPSAWIAFGRNRSSSTHLPLVVLFVVVQVLGSDPAPADQQDKEVRQLKQQLVQQWKEEQAAARAEAARAAQEQRQLQRQAEAQQRQQRQEELRRQLQDAKAAKLAQQQQQQQEAAVAAAAKQVRASVRPSVCLQHLPSVKTQQLCVYPAPC